MKTSPTQRTLKQLRETGWRCAITERWNPHAMIHQDLYGFIDILAICPGIILAVQCTSGANHASRREKILASEEAREWLQAGGKIRVVSWTKRGARGKRKEWTCREEQILIADLLTSKCVPSAEKRSTDPRPIIPCDGTAASCAAERASAQTTLA